MPNPTNLYQGLDIPERIFCRNIILFERLAKKELQSRQISNRMHHRHVLLRVIRTQGLVSIDGKTIQLDPGNALLITPYQFHHFIDVAKDSIQWTFITFELTQGQECLSTLRHIPLRLDHIATQLWDELIELWISPVDKRSNETLPILDRLLLYLLERHRETPATSQKKAYRTSHAEWIAKIEGLVIRSVREGWNLDEVAHRANISGRHLRGRFEAATGVALRDYRANYQLHTAMSLMRDSKLSLYEIAEICGFNSQPSFTRFIKRMTRATPQQLRSNLAKVNFALP